MSHMEGLKIDEQLFAITERMYEENLIKPSEYLKALKTMHQYRSQIELNEQELYKQRNELIYVAK